ncbi:hypothetical protein B7P43_G06248 [Cryptotermes secundus]|uniref:Uncharacterized protein n=1 Tax=Cryptotermes secundus TaxID=105785 RepID=A0A2J7PQH2_9NEOP|nr:hypothetical protein B7P43_G06248 [Cryptotermes secundus]
MNNMQVKCSFSFSCLYKGSLQLQPKYLLSQHAIVSCNNVPSVTIVLPKVFAIYTIKHLSWQQGMTVVTHTVALSKFCAKVFA